VSRKVKDNQLELVFEGGKVIIPPLIHDRAAVWALVNAMPAEVRDDGVTRAGRVPRLRGGDRDSGGLNEAPRITSRGRVRGALICDHLQHRLPAGETPHVTPNIGIHPTRDTALIPMGRHREAQQIIPTALATSDNEIYVQLALPKKAEEQQ
jgi:hypothetical protein